jgi:hypothetical protein
MEQNSTKAEIPPGNDSSGDVDFSLVFVGDVGSGKSALIGKFEIVH